MFQQMAEQDQLEREQMAALEQLQTYTFTDLRDQYLRMIGLLFVCFLLLVAYSQPPAIMRLIFPPSLQRLPPRHLVVLYDINTTHSIRSLVPPFEYAPQYARVDANNPEQTTAIQALQRMHGHLRRYLMDIPPRLNYKQYIHVHAWEHEDFQQQLRGDYMDQQCGNGFRHTYETSQAAIRDLGMLFCMMASGAHDGYVQWHVDPHVSLTRGYKGVAVQYVDQPERLQLSLLFLPLAKNNEFNMLPPTYQDRDIAKTKHSARSLQVPKDTLTWMSDYFADPPYEEEEGLRALEEFLYKQIADDLDSYYLFQAVCHDETAKAEWDDRHRCVATACRGDNCCWIYDPEMPPFTPIVHDGRVAPSSDSED